MRLGNEGRHFANPPAVCPSPTPLVLPLVVQPEQVSACRAPQADQTNHYHDRQTWDGIVPPNIAAGLLLFGLTLAHRL